MPRALHLQQALDEKQQDMQEQTALKKGEEALDSSTAVDEDVSLSQVDLKVRSSVMQCDACSVSDSE